MAAHIQPILMTVEEYDALPERDDVIVELHWGHLVEVALPQSWHVDLQDRIAELLKQQSGPDWKIRVEMPFRAVAQFDVRAADVGVVAKSRWDAITKGYLQGSPEIVIEILSPSNRAKQMDERLKLCLGTGADQFVLVDFVHRMVKVTSADGKTNVYRGDDEIPFPVLGTSIRVSEIWGD
jgi:Uma2 family endonuclease